MRILTTLATILLAYGSMPLAVRAEDFEHLTIRATPALPSSAIEFIAQVSETRHAIVRGGELPEKLIKEICGVNTNAFEKVFYGQLNTKLVREPKKLPRIVNMPACAKWRHEVTAQVGPNDNLDAILLRKIERTGEERFACPAEEGTQSPRCNKTFRELVQSLNPGKNLDRLENGDQIKLPFVTYDVTFKVIPPSGMTIQDVKQKITDLAKQSDSDSSLTKNEYAPSVRILGTITGDDVELVDKDCSLARRRTSWPWPYDWNLVGKVLRANMEAAAQADQQLSPTTVAVLDTGLATTFPETFLRADPKVEKKYAYGIGTFRRDNIRPFPEQAPPDLRLHGTHVAEILTGGSGLREAFSDLNKLLRIKIVNLIHPPSGNGGGYGIDSAELTNGVDWSTGNGTIANLSVGSESPLNGLRDVVRRASNFLLVVAAGNEANDIGEYGLYPANYGGLNDEIGNQVITVAAHNAKGNRASFSNFSSIYVDLLAPGCDISYDGGVNEGVYGTSFAAPLVSLTAALLQALGVRDPIDIKKRLHASVDYDPALADLVLWSGRLNMAKALSLYDDVVEIRPATESGDTSDSPKVHSANRLMFGKWLVDSDDDVCSLDLESIRKLTPVWENAALKILVLHSDSQKKLISKTCEPSGSGLRFIERGAGESIDISWKDLVDFVPHYFIRRSQ